MLHLFRINSLAHRPAGAELHRPVPAGVLARAMASHPAGTALADGRATDAPFAPELVAVGTPGLADEDGSLVTEYGLLAVVAATIAGVMMTWASGGALVTLFNALLRQARSLVGA
jgi:Flp pilus assembly pilin Flp